MEGPTPTPDGDTPDPQAQPTAADVGPHDTPLYVRKAKGDGPKNGRRKTADWVMEMPAQRTPDEILAASMVEFKRKPHILPHDWSTTRRPGQLPNPENGPDDPGQTYGTYNADGLFVIGRPSPEQDPVAYRRWRAAHPYADATCKGLTSKRRDESLRGKIAKLFESDAQCLQFVVDVAVQMGLTEDQIRRAKVSDIYIMAAMVHAMRGKGPYFVELNTRFEGRPAVTVQDNRADVPQIMQVIQDALSEHPEIARTIEQRIAKLGNKVDVTVDFGS